MDPRNAVRPGQPIALAAEQINWLNRQMRGATGASAESAKGYQSPYTWVIGKNETGSPIDRWDLLEITGVDVHPDLGNQFQTMPVLTLGGPSGDRDSVCCVAVEPIASGKYGRVAVSGVVQVKLDDSEILSGLVGPQLNSPLATASAKGWPVLWSQPSSDNPRFALVSLSRDSTVMLCKTTSEWEYGTSADLEEWHEGSPLMELQTTPTRTATGVVNRVATIPEGVFVLVGQAANGGWYLLSHDRTCSSEGHLASWATEHMLDPLTETTEVADGEGPQVLMHHEGCLEWRKLTELEVITYADVDETSIVFSRSKLWVLASTGEATEVVLTGTECPPPEPPP